MRVCVCVCVLCVAWGSCGICMGLACAQTKPTGRFSIRAIGQDGCHWLDRYCLNMVGGRRGRGTKIAIHLPLHWN